MARTNKIRIEVLKQTRAFYIWELKKKNLIEKERASYLSALRSIKKIIKEREKGVLNLRVNMPDRKEYHRQYYIGNQEKIKQYQGQYRIKNKEKIRRYQEQYRLENLRKIFERSN